MTIQQAIELARQHHQAGHLPEAESLYRQILAAEPNQPDAIHLLGVLALQAGQPDTALNLLHRAIAITPQSGHIYANLARVLSSLGRRSEAIDAYRKSISLQPSVADTRNNLANALLSEGLIDEAVREYRKAIELRPDFAEAYSNLGSALGSFGQHEEAIIALHSALRIKPQLADAHYNLGLVLKDTERFGEAVSEFRAALECRPSYPEAWNNLGSALDEQHHTDEAIEALRHALALRPAFPEALMNLGIVLRDRGQLDESISLIQRSLQLRPDSAPALNGLGNTLHTAGRFDEAASAFRKAIELGNDWDAPHSNLGFTLLMQGKYEEGWREYEWRRRVKQLGDRQEFDQPLWDGSDLNGRTILLHTEQGFGDAIFFCRYAPLVANRGGKVIVRCQPELACLMKTLDGIAEVVTSDAPAPPFDVHCPLLSLPRVLGTNSEAEIPRQVPYLHADPQRSAQWRTRMQLTTSKLKVGLVWAGRPDPPGRSIPLAQLAPLSEIPGITFVSVQYGDEAHQANSAPPGIQLLNWSSELKTFADTAALLENLDLLVSIDTSAAQLAGALGRRVWVLLQHVPDWRWMMNRSDSPWFPTMRLFRQTRNGDWSGPISELTAALRSFAAGA